MCIYVFIVIIMCLVQVDKNTVIMWHEARRQERKIRVMMVDYQKRADRRRQFYEQIVCIAAVLLHDAVENQFT